MLVYHGSNMIVRTPRLIVPTRGLDFGNGFYTTANFEQARRFARNVLLRNDGKGIPTVSFFETDDERIRKAFATKEFNDPNGEWLDFVRDNRLGKYTGIQYDIIIGPVANDTIYRTFRQYEHGDISRRETLKRLKISNLYNQITFCTERAVAELKFIKSEAVQNG
jgi:hypothetical protein